jgi:hypothetical protein
MTKLYNIKNNDMLYFLLFSVVLIPFQFIADVFTLSVLELFHGWKIYDYLIYTRYRFLQRETRWKGLEDSLDECIDESVRTLDQMCFSSQYYMMMTVQVSDSASVSERFRTSTLGRWRLHDITPPRRRRRGRERV